MHDDTEEELCLACTINRHPRSFCLFLAVVGGLAIGLTHLLFEVVFPFAESLFGVAR